MTIKLENAIKEIRKLPETDQDAAAEGLLAYSSRTSDYRLTDKQISELKSRLAAPLDILTDAEVNQLFSRLMA